ncbi:MAG: hypothetical protein ACM3ZQ_02580 [Bacillota bacterium]
MKDLNKEELTQHLMTEFSYPARGAALVAEKLMKLHPELEAQFVIWWHNGSLPRVTVEEYTVERLMHEHSMNPIAAMLTLDWLLREPEQAKASLKRGHDHAVRGS